MSTVPAARSARPLWSRRAVAAQVRAEVTMTLRRGESLLVTLGIPVGLLVFFSLVDVGFTDSVAKDP
ncbi:MAG TPA: hypothetical protein VGI06_05965, partial [Acidimicrobiales bacterium]